MLQRLPTSADFGFKKTNWFCALFVRWSARSESSLNRNGYKLMHYRPQTSRSQGTLCVRHCPPRVSLSQNNPHLPPERSHLGVRTRLARMQHAAPSIMGKNLGNYKLPRYTLVTLGSARGTQAKTMVPCCGFESIGRVPSTRFKRSLMLVRSP